MSTEKDKPKLEDNQVNRAALRIASRLTGEEDVKKFDILLIIAIAGFIINAIRLWRECNATEYPTPDKIGPFMKRRLTWMAKRHLKGFDVNGSDVTKEFLNEFKAMGQEEVAKVFAAAQ